MASRPTTLIVEYDDFRAGEFGTISAKKAPPNSFTGSNVIAFRDGSIGPRCGLFAVTPSGQSNGKVSAVGITGGAGSAEFWYAQGTSVYRFAAGGARSAAYTGSIVSPSTACDIVPINNSTQAYLMVPGDKTYLVDHALGTVTALTGSPTGRAMALFGTRLFVGGPTATPARINYSADANVNSWVDHIDLPGDPAVGIRGLYVQRDYLLIMRANGELWILTGTVGTNEVLRRVATPESAGGIFQAQRGKVDYNNEFWMVGMHSTAPEKFNGGRLDSVEYLGAENVSVDTPPGAWATSMLQTDVLPPEYVTVPLSQKSLGFFGGGSKGLLRRDGIWSKHSFGQTVVGLGYDATFGEPILTDGGAAGATPNFYVWNTVDDRPPMKSSGLKARDSIGDGSDTAPVCTFTTPEWSDAQGRRGVAQSVEVRFRKWATGVSQTNHFDLQVKAIDRYLRGSNTSAAQSFDDAASNGTTTGQADQVVYNLGDQGPGIGFQVIVDNLRGISIDSIRVKYVITEDFPG